MLAAVGEPPAIGRDAFSFDEARDLLASLGYLMNGATLDDAASAFGEDRALADANFDAAFLAALRAAMAGELPVAARRRRGDREKNVRDAQTQLVFLGYELYEIDGSMDERTREALARFAAEAGLVDSNVDPALVAVLKEFRNQIN
jgi:peptidoglycan hydrolase-like protein with peptidoglycan-binding domain